MLENSKLYISVLFIIFLCFGSCIAEDKDFLYEEKGKRNPFIALVTPDGRLLKLDKEESRGELVIEGIIYDKAGRSFAIVNGNVVGVGDKVLDFQVLKIDEDKVIFIKDGQPIEVEFKKENDK